MSKQERMEIERELRQLEATVNMLNERRYRLRRKLAEGVSTSSNARKGGLSESDAAALVANRRKKAFQ
jgi:hypothetical protein